ncbi:pilus assembly protein PilW [Pseudomonas sp. AFG_SD02_1510_Pfu_092]|uniref:PilW family protein n=1 Tax=Pseudomonas sp. AFG_SD02_1510_Pfu_092 TaxID=2259497 RepID=UPI000DEF4213|nr:prepilin-type N-terminal cleavage/methylation domain-containing protein [Pseudomonas sp. AFG_SD02_1510_Pfu_092]RCL26817.1 pilus assembly protein PilW [Pseudomonas sp. AFG_SD02_1510_Pfu_092]
MSRVQRGFGLLELMLALAIGLMLLAAVSQLFVSSHQTWRVQGAATRMHEDARLALLRIAQDIRMAGMFGCLRLQPDDFQDPADQQVFARPLVVGTASLSLVVAELPGHAGDPEWTLLTDCTKEARVYKGWVPGSKNLTAVPISQHLYVLKNNKLFFNRSGINRALVEHVRALQVVHVPGERVDLQLTLYEPTLQLEQHHALSVALRNRVPAS